MKFSEVPIDGRFFYIGPREANEEDGARGVWQKHETSNGLSFLADGIHSHKGNAQKKTGVDVGAHAFFDDNDLIRPVEEADEVSKK